MGVRPEVPPKHDHLKQIYTPLMEEVEEGEYLEPMQNHMYKDPVEEPEYERQQEDNMYEPMGGMEELE